MKHPKQDQQGELNASIEDDIIKVLNNDWMLGTHVSKNYHKMFGMPLKIVLDASDKYDKMKDLMKSISIIEINLQMRGLDDGYRLKTGIQSPVTPKSSPTCKHSKKYPQFADANAACIEGGGGGAAAAHEPKRKLLSHKDATVPKNQADNQIINMANIIHWFVENDFENLNTSLQNIYDGAPCHDPATRKIYVTHVLWIIMNMEFPDKEVITCEDLILQINCILKEDSPGKVNILLNKCDYDITRSCRQLVSGYSKPAVHGTATTTERYGNTIRLWFHPSMTASYNKLRNDMIALNIHKNRFCDKDDCNCLNTHNFNEITEDCQFRKNYKDSEPTVRGQILVDDGDSCNIHNFTNLSDFVKLRDSGYLAYILKRSDQHDEWWNISDEGWEIFNSIQINDDDLYLTPLVNNLRNSTIDQRFIDDPEIYKYVIKILEFKMNISIQMILDEVEDDEGFTHSGNQIYNPEMYDLDDIDLPEWLQSEFEQFK